MEAPEVTEARARAGKAIRDIGHGLVGHDADAELIDEVADTLDDLTALLAKGDVRRRVREDRAERWRNPVADGGRMVSYDERPFSGRSSPWGVDLEVHRHGDEIEAILTLRVGPRGRARSGRTAASSPGCSTTSSGSCSTSSRRPRSPAS